MKKKILIVFLIIASVLALAACDSTSGTDNNTDDETTIVITQIEVGEGSVVLDDPYEDYTFYNYVVLEPSTETITIEIGGVYYLEGEYSNIIIDTIDEDVDLVLNNATISSTKGPAVLVLSADVVTFSALEGTSNVIEDSSNHPLDGEEDYNGAIYSLVDLEFNGTGTLTVNGNYNNAIYTKDDVKIQDITLLVSSVDDGIVGKDYVAISNATVIIDVDGDGIASTNDGDADKGFVYIESGVIDITAGSDGIDAALAVLIYGGELSIYSVDTGIESDNTIVIEGGIIDIDSGNDGINAQIELKVAGGDITINASEDGMHSDDLVLIEGGNIFIQTSYEGIEGYVIVINDGNITVNSTDDGINATAGGGQAHGQELYISDGGTMYINGGVIRVNSVGDGVDVNGTIVMTDGYLLVYGSTTDVQSSIDFDTEFNISGGVVIALGSDGMVEPLSETSEQASLLYADGISYSAGTTVTLTDDQGTVLLEADAIKYFEAVTISTPDMVDGESYTLKVGTDEVDFTISSTVTILGSGGMTGPGGGGLPPRP